MVSLEQGKDSKNEDISINMPRNGWSDCMASCLSAICARIVDKLSSARSCLAKLRKFVPTTGKKRIKTA